MNDRWFEELIRVTKEDDARDRQALDERWDRLTAGALTAEEEAALRAEAELTEEGRTAWAAFRPLGPAFQASVVASVQAQQAAEGTVAVGTAERPPPYSRLVAWVGSGIVAAGFVAFALLRPFLGPALPPYTFQASAGDRGGNETVIVIGSPITLSAQPHESIPGPVDVRCVQTAAGAAPRFWPGCETHLQRLTDGTLRVKLLSDATAELAPGTLWLIVARPGCFPPIEDTPVEGTEERDPDGRWHAFPYPVQIPPP